MKQLFIVSFIILSATALMAQSRRIPVYSESSVGNVGKNSPQNAASAKESDKPTENKDTDIIKIKTDLVIVPVRVSDAREKAVTDLKQTEFKIFEDGSEQEIAYFSDEEQPFTVALVLDMSYSSVFKLRDIQQAALEFTNQLRPDDKVMVISFDEEVHLLCEPTNDRKILKLAVEGTEIASGTSFYSALDKVIGEKFKTISGRKAVVLFSDGVDTTSKILTPEKIIDDIRASDILVFPIQYDTYGDVQKSRKDSAQILYDEDDRPYSVETARKKGEREEDYKTADKFINELAGDSGGRVFRISAKLNLPQAFGEIVEELRKVYSLGYYPNSEPKDGFIRAIKVRVYRPKLTVRTKNNYMRR